MTSGVPEPDGITESNMKKLTILFALLAISCASRKKEVHSVETKSRFNATIDTSFSFKNQFNYAAALTSASQAQYQELNIEYEGCNPGDSINITQYGSDGKPQSSTTIKGKGKVNLKSGSGTRQETVQANAAGSGAAEGKASGKKDFAGETDNRILDKTVKTWAFPWWFWLVLVLIALVAAWRLNKKYNWISHVTKIFS
ncbi:hypothetical protein ACLI1A_10215 [Flavobacterium sp. RHBU_3]|uniref:hypothetical protein n=1 Tax=Flavobacterium sp. RHBU_3 TaxID=3391184 RepID=UPI0039847CDB